MIRLFALFILVLLPCKAQAFERNPQFSVALERQSPLNQNVDLDGIAFFVIVPFDKRFFAAADMSFLQTDVNGNDFTYQQQQVQLGINLYSHRHWQFDLLAGINRIQLEQSAATFENKDSDTAFAAEFSTEYQFDQDHKLAVVLSFQDNFAVERYQVHTRYSYRLDHNWQASIALELGYNRKIEHDSNGYLFMVDYLF